MAGRKARRGGGLGAVKYHTPSAPVLIDSATTGGVQPSGLTGWTLKMSEEFGGTITVTDAPNGLLKFRSDGPSWKAWYADGLITVGEPNNHTNNPGSETEWYDTSGVSLDGSGGLVLTATLDHVHSGLPYTSGMIQSNPFFNPLYGFFEAKLRYNAGADGWPAFWMIPASYTWPPEIDIWEITTGSASEYTVSNWGSGHTVFGNTVTSNTTVYQVIGCKWTSTQIVWYLNGSVVATENSGVPTEPMYPVINLATTASTTPSYTVHCDYIRVWQ